MSWDDLTRRQVAEDAVVGNRVRWENYYRGGVSRHEGRVLQSDP